mgnify:CR=1 FL=1
MTVFHPHLTARLECYARTWLESSPDYPQSHKWQAGEQTTWTQFRNFVEKEPQAFERSLGKGHVTASALIINNTGRQVLLHLHKKLGKWLQLGGHSDGNPRTDLVALKEAKEESGLVDFRWAASPVSGTAATPEPFDLDIHKIPANPYEQAHLHFDVRYLLIAGNPEKIVTSDESHDLQWFPLDQAYELTSEASMRRQFDKLQYIQPFL